MSIADACVLADRDTLAADNEDKNVMPFSNNVARWNVSRGLAQGSLNLDNPNLFLLGKDDARIYVGSYPHTWLMDVGADKWRQYFVDATVADNFDQPWSTQGQYLDNCLSTLGNLHSSGFSEPPQKYLDSGTWEVAMTGFLTTLSDAFKAHNVPTMANRGATRTDDGVRAWLMLDQETGHATVGQLEEGAFAVRWCSCDVQFFPLEDWERQVGLMGRIEHSALMYQSHSKLLSTGPPGRDNFGVSVSFWDVLWYSLGSFHVGKNEGAQTSYFAFSEGDYNAIPWYDEYTLLDLGDAQGTFSNQTIGGASCFFATKFCTVIRLFIRLSFWFCSEPFAECMVSLSERFVSGLQTLPSTSVNSRRDG